MTSDTTFNYLLIGLVDFLQSDKQYPYPELLQWSCHQLSLAMPTYPRTQTGLFKLLEKPLGTWYPHQLPNTFNATFGLLYDGELSEEASDYFYELAEQSELLQSPTGKQLALENFEFRKLFSALQQAHTENPVVAQQEYVLLRRFLIENPFALTEQLRQTFFRARYVTPEKVGGLYEPISEATSIWVCDSCGPLDIKYGQLRGVKPNVCNDHRKNLSYVHKVNLQPGLRRLKRGLHLRICIPGIPEIALFRELEDLCELSSAGLKQVHLYPGLDRYDLQLQFSDATVWAVDVKDYPNPLKLAPKLLPIYGEGSLRYDQSYYVAPQVYLNRTENYVTMARVAATALPQETQLLSEVDFENRVLRKIEQLKSGE